MHKATLLDLSTANLREDTRIRGTDAPYSALTFDRCFDNTKGFGEEQYGYDLI